MKSNNKISKALPLDLYDLSNSQIDTQNREQLYSYKVMQALLPDLTQFSDLSSHYQSDPRKVPDTRATLPA
uniref:Uncharacterized protein n=1 Tax=Arundo donax TaxID=35708 RepID=A0A0A8YGA2_ARUDO